MAKESVRSLIASLREDVRRRDKPFSTDLETTSELLTHPYATLPEMELALSRWLQRFQPCLFGRVAAAAGRMHYCILSDHDLQRTDAQIRDRIVAERALWKQRALRGGTKAPHGFLLLLASPRVLYAAPDQNLRRLAERIRHLWNCPVESDGYGNDKTWEHLFLRHPKTGEYHRFQFTVDFFAAAADGTWWQDHRIPGGIAFTANSLGHMMMVREWYQYKKNQEEWALRLAMMTIAEAATTESGEATSLVELQGGAPMKAIACPFASSSKLPERIQGKDWTTYQGVLHTDHSIRAEFFDLDDKPPLRARPWLMDFTYIYDKAQQDYVRFTRGQLISEEEVFREIGPPGEWRTLSPTRAPASARPRKAALEIRSLLSKTSRWALGERALNNLLR